MTASVPQSNAGTFFNGQPQGQKKLCCLQTTGSQSLSFLAFSWKISNTLSLQNETHIFIISNFRCLLTQENFKVAMLCESLVNGGLKQGSPLSEEFIFPSTWFFGLHSALYIRYVKGNEGANKQHLDDGTTSIGCYMTSVTQSAGRHEQNLVSKLWQCLWTVLCLRGYFHWTQISNSVVRLTAYLFWPMKNCVQHLTSELQ